MLRLEACRHRSIERSWSQLLRLTALRALLKHIRAQQRSVRVKSSLGCVLAGMEWVGSSEARL